MKTLLIVGGRPQTIRKAAECGLRVVFLQLPTLLTPEHLRAADVSVAIDYTDWELLRPLVHGLHEAYRFDHVLSLAEPAMEAVGRINDLLGLPGTSFKVAARFKDKALMRLRLDEAGVAGSVAAELVDRPDSVARFAAAWGYPVIVKPVDSTASRGVFRVDDAEQAAASWDRIDRLRRQPAETELAALFPMDRFLVEQYVEGPEFSVETLSFSGRHIVVAITEKLSRGFTELGHAEPARLGRTDEAAIERCVQDLLTALGLCDGVAHTEVRLGPDGVRVIESHNRVGGDRIMDLVEATYGVDLELYSVAAPFGLVPELTERPQPGGAAATRFFFVEAGTVTAIEGLQEVRAQPGVLDAEVTVRVGQLVTATADNFGRAGQVLVRAADTGAAVRACQDCADRISIAVRAEPLTPEPR